MIRVRIRMCVTILGRKPMFDDSFVYVNIVFWCQWLFLSGVRNIHAYGYLRNGALKTHHYYYYKWCELSSKTVAQL